MGGILSQFLPLNAKCNINSIRFVISELVKANAHCKAVVPLHLLGALLAESVSHIVDPSSLMSSQSSPTSLNKTEPIPSLVNPLITLFNKLN
jgi:hypothetical protein